MPKQRKYRPLNIYLNTKLVGQLTREYTGAIKFKYDIDWLDWQSALPVSLSMPLREDPYAGPTVVAVFDNLLPDYEPIRNRVAERVGAHGTDAFSLLSKIGRDCVGALQFLPEDEVPQSVNEITGKELTPKDISQLLNALDIAPLGLRSENDFRISIAGAQEKTALLYYKDNWIEPHGTTPTSHIIKPQIGKLANGMDLSHSVENEFFCLRLIKAFGLRVARAEIARFEDQKALIIERFDRKWSDTGKLYRLPQEDCCQALSFPPTLKYQSGGGPGIEQIMDILIASDEPTQDRSDFFKSQILFWLIGATDGHAKNFSLALSSLGRFRMTPIYDVLTVQPSFDQNQITHKEFKLAMRVGKSNQYNVERIRGRHFIDTGVQCGLSRELVLRLFHEIHDQADSALQSTIENIPDDFPDEIIESVSAALKLRLPRLTE